MYKVKSISTRVFILLFCMFSVGIFGTILGQEQDYYIVEGKKIYLQPSQKYSALKLKPGTSPSVMNTFRADIDLAGFGKVEDSPDLKKHNIILVRIKEGVGPSSFRKGTAVFRAKEEVESENPVFGVGGIDQVLVNEFIVQFESDVTENQITDSLKEWNVKVVKKDEKIKNRYIITFTDRSAREALAFSNTLHDDQAVVFSEPNFIRIYPNRPEIKKEDISPQTPLPAATPTDPLFPNQWYLHNTGSIGVAGADIKAKKAWDITKGSSSIIVAIIDEGVDTGHIDLKDKIVDPYDATDGDNDQEPNSWDGHGTACAGIAAAIADNGQGVAGIGWNVKILPIRIAFSNYDGGDWITTNAIIEDGIRTAVDRNAHVLSNSWGGGTPSSAINSAIDYAISENRVVVFSAGNWATVYGGPKNVSYPANLSTSRTIIAVSATNEWDNFKTPTSQDGETWWGSCFGPEVNVSAPGVHMCTTDISGSDGYSDGNWVGTFNGTSSAAPLVAGTVALLLSKHPDWSPAEVRDRLQSTAKDLGPPGFDNEFGYGRIDACGALGGCDSENNCITIASVSLPADKSIGQVLVNVALLFSTVLLFLLFLAVRKLKAFYKL
jgi:subtilisin family serine protease